MSAEPELRPQGICRGGFVVAGGGPAGPGIPGLAGAEALVAPGSCIYLPRQVKHSMKNLEDTPIRLMGVFHPSGSPATSYDE